MTFIRTAILSVCWAGLSAFVLMSAHAAPEACVAVEGQPQRWYSPLPDNWADTAPLQCQTCAHPENHDHPSCAVYRALQSEDCQDGECATDQGEFRVFVEDGYAIQRSTRFERPLKYLFDIGSNCWFLLWALDPVIGVEHAGARDRFGQMALDVADSQSIDSYWQLAISASQNHIDPPIPEDDIALLIQSADWRSQHQLHLHIGRLAADFRRALNRLSADPTTDYVVMLNQHRLFVRYLPDHSGQTPLQGYAVFDIVKAMIPGGEAWMPLYGVLAARDQAAAGTWIMAAKSLNRRELIFSHSSACVFRQH